MIGFIRAAIIFLLINCAISQETGLLRVLFFDYDNEEVITDGIFTLIHPDGETSIHSANNDVFPEIELNTDYQIVATKVNGNRNFYTWDNALNFTSISITFSTNYEGINEVIGYYKEAVRPNITISDSNGNIIQTNDIEIYDEWATGFNAENSYIALSDWFDNNENKVFYDVGLSYSDPEEFSYKLKIKRLFSTSGTGSDGIYKLSSIELNNISIYFQIDFNFPDSSPYISEDCYLETPVVFYINNNDIEPTLILYFDKVNETLIDSDIILLENEVLEIKSVANILFNHNTRLVTSGTLIIGEQNSNIATLTSISDEFNWGGIVQMDKGNLFILNSQISEANTALKIGGIELSENWESNIEINSSTFFNNDENITGVGLINNSDDNELNVIEINNCEFYGDNEHGQITFSFNNSAINIMESNFYGADLIFSETFGEINLENNQFDFTESYYGLTFGIVSYSKLNITLNSNLIQNEHHPILFSSPSTLQLEIWNNMSNSIQDYLNLSSYASEMYSEIIMEIQDVRTDNYVNVYNNTIIEKGIEVDRLVSNDEPTNFNIFNNIFYGNDEFAVDLYGYENWITNNMYLYHDFNIFFGFQYTFWANNFVNPDYDPYEIPLNEYEFSEVDPLFVNVENNNFSLLSNSPCINAGHDDLNGNGIDWDGPDDSSGTADDDIEDQDPDGTRMDIGAFYYHQIMGDANLDGTVNVADVVNIVQFILLELEFDYNQLRTADINEDGLINVNDIIIIINIILDIPITSNNLAAIYLSGMSEAMNNGAAHRYTLHMLNEQDVPILHFKLSFNDKIPLQLSKTARSQGMELDYNYEDETGILHIVIYNLTGGKIASGYGPILEMTLESTALGRGSDLTDGSEFLLTHLTNNPDNLLPVVILNEEDMNRKIDGLTAHNALPHTFNLHPVYPNPFNPETTISYEIGIKSLVELSIINIKGQMVGNLVNETNQPGQYVVNWNAKDMPSGIYLVRMKTPYYSVTQKIILLK